MSLLSLEGTLYALQGVDDEKDEDDEQRERAERHQAMLADGWIFSHADADQDTDAMNIADGGMQCSDASVPVHWLVASYGDHLLP